MQPRRTIFWLILAALLLGGVLWQQHRPRPGALPQAPVLPEFHPRDILTIQTRPAGPQQLEIRAQRGKDGWMLTEPLAFPAQSASIDGLLEILRKLTPAAVISGSELIVRPNTDAEYGFTPPRAISIILQQANSRLHLLVGNRTAPGDQVFLEVVGHEAIYVVDADLLKHLPASADDWRDRSLAPGAPFAFDRICLTNAPAGFAGGAPYGCELTWDRRARRWRMTFPLEARADNARIEASLEKLRALRIQDFVSDEARADLEPFGLAAPELEVALHVQTNRAVLLQFGKAVGTNGLVYARRVGETAIFTVPREPLAGWRGSVNDFREPHLADPAQPVDWVDVRAEGEFRLERQTNNTWTIQPDHLPGDPELARRFIALLAGVEIQEFKDAVTGPDLAEYGLAEPWRRYTLGWGAGASDRLQLDFGVSTNQPGRIFARRSDETSVYGINTNQVWRLPAAGWELRRRRLWSFAIEDVAAVTISEADDKRRLLRRGEYSWSLAPGSQGIINELAVEETVRALTMAEANAWVACGETNLAPFGFSPRPYEIVLELKNGEKPALSLGGESPSGFWFAAVPLAGKTWVFELSPVLCRDLLSYLRPPARAAR